MITKKIINFTDGRDLSSTSPNSNIAYGCFRIINLNISESASGNDTEGILLNIPALYDYNSSNKVVLQLFFGYQTGTLHFRVYWYGTFTEWKRLSN